MLLLIFVIGACAYCNSDTDVINYVTGTNIVPLNMFGYFVVFKPYNDTISNDNELMIWNSMEFNISNVINPNVNNTILFYVMNQNYILCNTNCKFIIKYTDLKAEKLIMKYFVANVTMSFEYKIKITYVPIKSDKCLILPIFLSVIFIIILLSSIVFVNYYQYKKQL